MIRPLIGSISLNVSFLLYLVLYLPQIIHNKQSKNIEQLSLNLHLLIYTSYFFDLCYGFAKQLPWQYKTVSVIGLVLLSYQHIQLIQLFIRNQHERLVRLCVVFSGFTFIALFCFFSILHGALSEKAVFIFGSIARIAGLLYYIPQLIKNKKIQSANALNVHFVYLNLTLATLDMISSWCLDWGWPNKLAAPLSMILMIIMLMQIKHYRDNRLD